MLTRAVTLSATTLALGAGSHVVAGGSPAPIGVLAVLGSLLLVAALLVSRRRLRVASVAPLVAVAQVLVHTVLTWVHQAQAVTVSGSHAHGAAATVTAAGGGATAHLGSTMLLAHLAATALTVGALVGADRAAAAARHWWTGVVVLTHGAPAQVPRLALPRPAPAPVRTTAHPLARGLARRGPPAIPVTA